MRASELRPAFLIEKLLRVNDGTRTLFESVMVPEVAAALKDFHRAGGTNKAVLIGGLAVSFYGLPRTTMDVDFMFLSPSDVPNEVQGFKKIRAHAFQHNQTHVEIEVLDPSYLGLPQDLVQAVFDTAVTMDGMKVASKSGIIALKLFRMKRYDQGDVEQLAALGDIDLTPFHLSQDKIDVYNRVVSNM